MIYFSPPTDIFTSSSTKFGFIQFQLTFQQLLQMLTGEVLLVDFHVENLPTIQNKQNCALMKQHTLHTISE